MGGADREWERERWEEEERETEGGREGERKSVIGACLCICVFIFVFMYVCLIVCVCTCMCVPSMYTSLLTFISCVHVCVFMTHILCHIWLEALIQYQMCGVFIAKLWQHHWDINTTVEDRDSVYQWSRIKTLGFQTTILYESGSYWCWSWDWGGSIMRDWDNYKPSSQYRMATQTF